MRCVSKPSASVPATISGCARIASATERSAVPGAASTRRRYAEASPRSDVDSTGAPHPSTPVDPTGSPVSSSNVARICRCSGCSGARYPSVGQPLTTQVRSMPACLPEQFMNSRSRPLPPRTSASRASSDSG